MTADRTVRTSCGPDAELATWSPCRRYRYTLRRPDLQGLLDRGEDVCAFVLLNPSTATETEDDPTIRRCIDFARRWGFHELQIVNVYAWRSTDPKVLPHVAEPVGPSNDQAIADVVARARWVICGWGKNAQPERVARVAEILAPARGRVFALAVNKDGSPQHPLYLPATAELRAYTPAIPVKRQPDAAREVGARLGDSPCANYNARFGLPTPHAETSALPTGTRFLPTTAQADAVSAGMLVKAEQAEERRRLLIALRRRANGPVKPSPG